MTTVQFLQAGLLIWLGLLAMLVVGRVLKHDVSTAGLLTSRGTGGAIDPERVLAMAIAPTILAYYVITTLNLGYVPVINGRPSLPEISDNMLMLLTGGNGLYLAGKIARQGKG